MNKYIGCRIEYETKTGMYIVTDLDEAKARFLSSDQSPIKEGTLHAYKLLKDMSDDELKLFFKHGYKKTKKGIADLETGIVHSLCTEIDVTKVG